MNSKSTWEKSVAISILAVLLLSFAPHSVNGQEIRERIMIHVGAPSVWSMGQAHYLLAKMHQDNRNLQTKMPKDVDLDPNAINITKIQILRTLLGIEAQFDEKIGVENRAALTEYKRKLAQRSRADAELAEKEAEFDALDADLRRMKRDQAKLNADLQLRKQERESKTVKNPNPPPDTITPLPDEEEKNLIKDKAGLDARIASKEKEREDLVKEIDALKATSTGEVAKPALSDVEIDSKPGQLPGFTYLQDYLKKAVEQTDKPRLAATTVLDNFIGMQYEIISKQLTLLRDEVGPDNRIVFLELPASIYTAASRGDNYVAQVQWKITDYAENKSADSCPLDLINSNNQKKIYKTPGTDNTLKIREQIQTKFNASVANSERINFNNRQPANNTSPPISTSTNTANMVPQQNQDPQAQLNPATPDLIRAIDLIPRQSALNVNEVQATSRQFNFLGVLKLLIGFGLKVDYQRQKELYEQFLQQEVFAAGFGKGLNTFGWTFGPLPGSKRITSGVRTMYAVLVVPRYTSHLVMEATGVAFSRKHTPELNNEGLDYSNNPHHQQAQVVFPKTPFTVQVPNENNENFCADSIYYTPAPTGGVVSAVIEGRYFSNNLGVLVDGVPLKRVSSIGNSTYSNAEASEEQAKGITGQFELANSSHLVMKFSMGDNNYVGTPNITLVSPQKSSSINYFIMEVNGDQNRTLREHSLVAPMFIEQFSLDKEIPNSQVMTAFGYVLAYIKGTGLRRGAAVWIDGRPLKYFSSESARQIDTHLYRLFFKPQNPNNWSGRFRQSTNNGFAEAEFAYKKPAPPDVKCEIRGSMLNPSSPNRMQFDIRFLLRSAISSPGQLYPTGLIIPGGTQAVHLDAEDGSNKQYRGLFYIDLAGREQLNNTITLKIQTDRTTFYSCDVSLPLRPQILNAIISAPSSAEEPGALVTIEGINLQNVVKVFVGDEEASIIGEAGSAFVTVKVKKGVFIKEKKGIKIPISVITKEGVKVHNVITQ